MEEAPLVSIIMPSYNSEEYIKESIESVLHQTYCFWELIIVDGGSLDSTKLIVESFQLEDSRIIFLDNSLSDKGPAHARALAIRAAKGKYIAFIDSDDLWLPEKLLRQINFMESNRMLFTFTFYKQLLKNGRLSSTHLHAQKKYSFPGYLGCRGIGNLTVIVNAELFTSEILNTYQYRAEDTIWWLLIMRSGVTAYLFPEVLAYYRITPGSLSSQRLNNQFAVWRAYRNVIKLSHHRALFYYITYIFDVLFRRIKNLSSSILATCNKNIVNICDEYK